jgi:tRNA-dihydrouridine synthase
LGDPQWIHDCIRAIREACPGRGVSVKLRTGLADPAESREILPAVAEAEPDFSILHFRTVQEQYADVSKGYERITAAKELVGDLPILASGDLFSVKDAADAWRIARCDGIAPARGLFRNPFIIQDLHEACRTGAAPCRTERDVLAVLATEAEAAAGRGIPRTGFLLEAARQAFSTKNPIFARLARAGNPAEFARIARAH